MVRRIAITRLKIKPGERANVAGLLSSMQPVTPDQGHGYSMSLFEDEQDDSLLWVQESLDDSLPGSHVHPTFALEKAASEIAHHMAAVPQRHILRRVLDDGISG